MGIGNHHLKSLDLFLSTTSHVLQFYRFTGLILFMRCASAGNCGYRTSFIHKLKTNLQSNMIARATCTMIPCRHTSQRELEVGQAD